MTKYLPKRITVQLRPDASAALAELAERLGIKDPRVLASDLVRKGLGLAPICHECEHEIRYEAIPEDGIFRVCLCGLADDN